MATEPTNADRTQWAEQCIKKFMNSTRCDREDALQDLLTDLMHWAGAEGQDFRQTLANAAGNYIDECREEGKTPAAPQTASQAELIQA